MISSRCLGRISQNHLRIRFRLPPAPSRRLESECRARIGQWANGAPTVGLLSKAGQIGDDPATTSATFQIGTVARYSFFTFWIKNCSKTVPGFQNAPIFPRYSTNLHRKLCETIFFKIRGTLTTGGDGGTHARTNHQKRNRGLAANYTVAYRNT